MYSGILFNNKLWMFCNSIYKSNKVVYVVYLIVYKFNKIVYTVSSLCVCVYIYIYIFKILTRKNNDL